jgi:hypothetical protein
VGARVRTFVRRVGVGVGARVPFRGVRVGARVRVFVRRVGARGGRGWQRVPARISSLPTRWTRKGGPGWARVGARVRIFVRRVRARGGEGWATHINEGGVDATVPSKDLKKQAQTEAEKTTLARVMFAEGKDIDEVVEATGFDREKAGGIKGFMNSDPGKKWYDDYKGKTEHGDEEGSEGSGGSSGGGGTNEKPKGAVSKIDELDLRTDDATALRSILKRTLGVASPQAISLLEEVEADPHFYRTNPIQLYSSLTLMGLSNDRAKGVAQQYAARVGDKKTRERFDKAMLNLDVDEGAGKPEATPEDRFQKMFERALRLREMELMGTVLGTGKAPEPKAPEPRRGDERLDRLMDRAEEYKVMSTIFKDESGMKSVQAEEVTEYERTKNDDGTEQFIPVRTIKRPLPPSGTQQQPAQDEFDKILTQMAKVQMVKMLGAGVGGAGAVPGMETITEPILDAEGHPIFDKLGQPVVRTHTVPSGAGAKGASDLAVLLQLADKQQEGMVKVAEIMKEKDGGSVGDLTQLMLKRIDQLGDSQIKMLTDQVNALQNQDPLGYVSDLVDKLKKIGAFGGKEQSLEVAKLSTDLEKWEFDKDQEFKRWAWEQRQTMEDKKYARKQLEEFGRTVREGIEKVAAPVAKGFQEGYVEQSKRSPAGSVRTQRPAEQAEKDIKDMSDEEIQAMLGKVNTAEKTVEKARENLVAEISRRGIKV